MSNFTTNPYKEDVRDSKSVLSTLHEEDCCTDCGDYTDEKNSLCDFCNESYEKREDKRAKIQG